MNKEETEKFNLTLSEGFKELIVNRPEKPLDHFIYFLMSQLPEETRQKDKKLHVFFEKYEKNEFERKQKLDKTNQDDNDDIDNEKFNSNEINEFEF